MCYVNNSLLFQNILMEIVTFVILQNKENCFIALVIVQL